MKEQQRKQIFLENKEQQDNEMVHKQQILEGIENEMNGAVAQESDEIKVMYTIIDGIINKINKLVDYLKEEKPEIVCLTETKLCEKIQTNIENDSYNIWRKDRKDKNTNEKISDKSYKYWVWKR